MRVTVKNHWDTDNSWYIIPTIQLDLKWQFVCIRFLKFSLDIDWVLSSK